MSEIQIKRKNELLKKFFNEREMLLEISAQDTDFKKEFETS